MKVRIGLGLGTRTAANDQESYAAIVDDAESLGFDSLWLSERVSGSAPDPVVAMSFAAGRTRRLKFGMSVMVLPGRNPVLVAKALASLDRLSDGRLLPAMGLGAVNLAEHQAFGVRRKDRGPIFDEALPLIRRLWSGETVDHHGAHFDLEGVTVQPAPRQETLDVWLGGIAPSELRRVGRLGDGWLPSFCTPKEVGEGIDVIKGVAAENDRQIDPEHYGALIAYCDNEIPPALAEFVSRRRPRLEPRDLIVQGRDGLRARIESFIEHGASKFVVVPIVEPDDWASELEALADSLLVLET